MTVARQYREERMTLEEYRNLPEHERVEVIEGVVYDLAAPSPAHQETALEMAPQLRNYLKGKTCKVFMAPLDVFLEEDLRPTVVQPDVLVVCDPKKIQKNGCHGAPDMILEVISPSTAGHDMITKMELYRKCGVREYWVVDPERQLVQVYLLMDSMYALSGVYDRTGKVKVSVLDDCIIDMESVFEVEE